MTSAELKYRVKLQEWAARIQDCRSSGLSVRAWCRQKEINSSNLLPLGTGIAGFG